MPPVNPIPSDYPTVTPYLIVDGAAKAIDFYKQVFGATERGRLAGPDGKVGHAELQIGTSVIMLADECPEMGASGPKTIGDTPVKMHIYVEDSDAIVAKAVAAGATIVRPLEDKFYGDRAGMIADPFGHMWHIASRKEILTSEEIGRRASELFSK